MNLKESKERYMEEFGGRTEQKKNMYYNLKKYKQQFLSHFQFSKLTRL